MPLGLGYTVLDTIRLPNVRLEMVALNKKKKHKKKQQQQQKNKQQNKANYLYGRNRKKNEIV